MMNLSSQLIDHGNGVVELKLPKGVLPGNLVEAFQAVMAQQMDRVVELMDDTSLPSFAEAAAENPSYANVIALLTGMILRRMHHLDQAETWLRSIPEPEANALVFNELASLYQGVGRFSEEYHYRQKALVLAPMDVDAQANHAVDVMMTGRYEEGIHLLRETVRDHPTDASIHSHLLFYLHYLPNISRQEFYEEHLQWGRRHAPLHLVNHCFTNIPDPYRCLKIGYVSSNFYEHSVAYNFEAVLDGRNHQAMTLYGYSHVGHPDSVTERLAGKFDYFHNIYSMSDEEVIQLVQDDQIDILVEIAGHVGGNRLKVFAYKPAPIQVDFGGIDTSGMVQIDYRLTDCILDPPGVETFYTEQRVSLPGGYVCYTPPCAAPDCGPLPALRNGFISFAAFNAHLKINPHVTALWARVLKAVPDSKLLMKFPAGVDPQIKEQHWSRFEQHGIARERIDICGLLPQGEHLNIYKQVDLCLDTFPFNGCLTTLEALWMGVPTLSLVGQTYTSRVGLTILKHSHLDLFAVSTADEFVNQAKVVTQNVDALAKIRASLRSCMQSSVLCDHDRFCRELEGAYRWMWHQWCQDQGVEISRESRTDVHV